MQKDFRWVVQARISKEILFSWGTFEIGLNSLDCQHYKREILSPSLYSLYTFRQQSIQPTIIPRGIIHIYGLIKLKNIYSQMRIFFYSHFVFLNIKTITLSTLKSRQCLCLFCPGWLALPSKIIQCDAPRSIAIEK